MSSQESRVKRGVRLVRTRQRTPDFVRKAGAHRDIRPRVSRRAELAAALDEWDADNEDIHSEWE